jgi:hypothetical protein
MWANCWCVPRKYESYLNLDLSFGVQICLVCRKSHHKIWIACIPIPTILRTDTKFIYCSMWEYQFCPQYCTNEVKSRAVPCRWSSCTHFLARLKESCHTTFSICVNSFNWKNCLKFKPPHKTHVWYIHAGFLTKVTAVLEMSYSSIG